MEMQGSRTQGNLAGGPFPGESQPAAVRMVRPAGQGPGDTCTLGSCLTRRRRKSGPTGRCGCGPWGSRRTRPGSLARAGRGRAGGMGRICTRSMPESPGRRGFCGNRGAIREDRRGGAGTRAALPAGPEPDAGGAGVSSPGGDAPGYAPTAATLADGADAPENCPACGHGRAYFSRQEEARYPGRKISEKN